MPDVPAIAEVVPGYSVSGWNGMWAPAGTPREIVSRLNQALARILKQPDVQERLRADSREPAHSTPEEFTRVIARDIATWYEGGQVAGINRARLSRRGSGTVSCRRRREPRISRLLHLFH